MIGSLKKQCEIFETKNKKFDFPIANVGQFIFNNPKLYAKVEEYCV